MAPPDDRRRRGEVAIVVDDRDQAAEERLAVLGDQFGAFRCRTVFNCTEACPREIPVTQLIGEVKQVLSSGRIE